MFEPKIFPHQENTEMADRGPEKKSPKTTITSVAPKEIVDHCKDAIVSITSEILLTTLSGPTIPTSGTNVTSTFVTSNGFFIRIEDKIFIVCPSAAVLIPPTELASRNRFPYVTTSDPTPDSKIPNAMTKVSRILVDRVQHSRMRTCICL